MPFDVDIILLFIHRLPFDGGCASRPQTRKFTLYITRTWCHNKDKWLRSSKSYKRWSNDYCMWHTWLCGPWNSYRKWLWPCCWLLEHRSHPLCIVNLLHNNIKDYVDTHHFMKNRMKSFLSSLKEGRLTLVDKNGRKYQMRLKTWFKDYSKLIQPRDIKPIKLLSIHGLQVRRHPLKTSLKSLRNWENLMQEENWE